MNGEGSNWLFSPFGYNPLKETSIMAVAIILRAGESSFNSSAIAFRSCPNRSDIFLSTVEGITSGSEDIWMSERRKGEEDTC